MKKLLAIITACTMLLSAQLTCFAEEGTVNPGSAVNVRDGASTQNTNVIASIQPGTSVEITEETKDSSGNVWYKITAGNTTGYIRSDLVTKASGNATETTTAPAAETQTQAETADAAVAAVNADANNENAADGGAAEAAAEPVATSAFLPDTSVPEGVESIPAQYANISVGAGKVRGGASTNDSIVDTLGEGTQVILLGNVNGTSDGKLWYYVTFFGQDGSNKNGYIRSDLVNLGDLLPTEVQSEEAQPEESVVEEQPVTNDNADYELVYTDDGSGQNVWYLYNHIDNTRQKVNDLLLYVSTTGGELEKAQSQASTFKLLAIIFGVLFALAVIGIIVLAIKLRNSYYESYDDEYDYEYEDDDDEDDDDDDEDDDDDYGPSRRRGLFKRRKKYEDDDDDDEPIAPAKKSVNSNRNVQVKAQQNAKKAPANNGARANHAENHADGRKTGREVSYEDDYRVQNSNKKPTTKKPKNFLIEDDDFEFEFLNMDDN